MNKFNKILEKKMKDKGKMSDMEKKAKMSVLEDVRGLASDMMKDKLNGGMKKVTVASDSPEGLKEGLEKAEEIVEGTLPEMSSEEGMEEDKEEMEGEGESSESDMESMSEEEIDAKLEELMALKKKLKEPKSSEE